MRCFIGGFSFWTPSNASHCTKFWDIRKFTSKSYKISFRWVFYVSLNHKRFPDFFGKVLNKSDFVSVDSIRIFKRFCQSCHMIHCCLNSKNLACFHIYSILFPTNYWLQFITISTFFLILAFCSRIKSFITLWRAISSISS